MSNNFLQVTQLCSATQSSGQLSRHDCFDSLVVFITANSSFICGAMTLSDLLVTSHSLGLNPPLLLVFCSIPHVELAVEGVFTCAVR